MSDKPLQQSNQAEISISADPWEQFHDEYPIGPVRAILWMAAFTGAQMGVHWLIENHHLTPPGWLPSDGPQLGVMLAFTFALLIFWKFLRKAKLRTLGLSLERLPGDLKFFALAALGMGAFYLLAAGVYWLVLQGIVDEPDLAFKDHLRGAIFKDYSFSYLLGVVLLFPVLEEIWFRGLLYPPLRERWGRWITIVVLSLLFAFAHSNKFPINQFFGGLIFAWAFEKRRTLVAPMLLHILGNGALAVLGWALVKWQLV